MLKQIADRLDAWLQSPSPSDPEAVVAAHRDSLLGVAVIVETAHTAVDGLARLLAEQAAGVRRSPVVISQQRKELAEQLVALSKLRTTVSAQLSKLPKDSNHAD